MVSELWRPDHSGAVAETLCVLILIYSAVLAPWLSNRRYNCFIARVAVDPGARPTYYRRLAISQIVRLAVSLLIAFAVVGARPAGLLHATTPPQYKADLGPYLVGAAVGAVLGVLIAQRRISQGRRLPGLRRLGPLMPRTMTDRRYWALISLGAGTSEELLFRGVLPSLLIALAPSLSLWWVLFIQAAIFGFAHLYQRWIGVVGTGVVGYVLGSAVLATGQLWPAMVVHVLIDIRWVFIKMPADPMPAEAAR